MLSAVCQRAMSAVDWHLIDITDYRYLNTGVFDGARTVMTRIGIELRCERTQNVCSEAESRVRHRDSNDLCKALRCAP